MKVIIYIQKRAKRKKHEPPLPLLADDGAVVAKKSFVCVENGCKAKNSPSMRPYSQFGELLYVIYGRTCGLSSLMSHLETESQIWHR